MYEYEQKPLSLLKWNGIDYPLFVVSFLSQALGPEHYGGAIAYKSGYFMVTQPTSQVPHPGKAAIADKEERQAYP